MENPASPVETASMPAEPYVRSLRLDYLDGLRGLCALTVVFYHACLEVNWRWDGGGLSPWMQRVTQILSHGRFPVDVFIVLSGYCLMLPVARTADGRLRGGLKRYLARRARRILPPYYAALALSLILIAAVPGLASRSNSHWDEVLPAFTPGAIVSHLLLVHNLRPTWEFKINDPMWSVATEWQIYFLFPLFLLPVWRRLGSGALIAAAFGIGLAPHFLLHGRFDLARPWFIGLFALGMAAAAIGMSDRADLQRLRDRMPWGVITLLFIGIDAMRPQAVRPYWFIDDSLTGCATASFLLFCTRALMTEPLLYRRPLALRILEARIVVSLGAFSYSLYLIHRPVLGIGDRILRGIGASPDARLLTLLLVWSPCAILAAWLFARVFEPRDGTARRSTAVVQAVE